MHAVVALAVALTFPTQVHPHHGQGAFERSYVGVAAHSSVGSDPFEDIDAVSFYFGVEGLASGAHRRSVGWNAQCNGSGGYLRVRPHRLVVREVFSTLIGCPPRREREDRWLGRLMEGRPAWHLDGRRLILSGRVGTLVLRPDHAVR
jgi:heat shock protein HslJ